MEIINDLKKEYFNIRNKNVIEVAYSNIIDKDIDRIQKEFNLTDIEFDEIKKNYKNKHDQ